MKPHLTYRAWAQHGCVMVWRERHPEDGSEPEVDRAWVAKDPSVFAEPAARIIACSMVWEAAEAGVW